MQVSNPFKTLLPALVALAAMYMGSSLAPAQNQPNPRAEAKGEACPNDDSGLQLPAGFCATVFADDIGHARHMVAAPSGVLYVNTWSGKYYGNDTPHAGGFLVALQDKSGAGKADVIQRFGETVQSGGAGGTGIGLYRGSIYTEINDRIVRYSLPARLHRAEWLCRYYRLRIATGRRPSDASIHHQFRRIDVRRCRHRDQFLPAEKSDTQVARRGPLHGTRDSWWHLAL